MHIVKEEKDSLGRIIYQEYDDGSYEKYSYSGNELSRVESKNAKGEVEIEHYGRKVIDH